MAEEKKGFVLYADLIHTIRQLPAEKAGILFLHILSYVNDENPTTDDLIVNLAFEPIKQQLKRDLKNWEQKKRDRAAAGQKGGQASAEARAKSKQNQATVEFATPPLTGVDDTQANQAVIGNGKVNGKVTITDIYKTPIDFLHVQVGEFDMQVMAMQSTLPIEEFNFACTQWSLSKEADGWEYGEDKQKDRQMLESGLRKWLNTWVRNYRKGSKNTNIKPTEAQKKTYNSGRYPLI